MEEAIKVKTKVVPWYDKNNNKTTYGIDIKINNGKWAHVKDDKGPLFYDTHAEALENCHEIHNTILNK